jgi:hypothetical protein
VGDMNETKSSQPSHRLMIGGTADYYYYYTHVGELYCCMLRIINNALDTAYDTFTVLMSVFQQRLFHSTTE